MKLDPSASDTSPVDPKDLRRQILEARAEAHRTEDAAHRAKARAKKAKKALKQAKKVAKKARKVLKALLAQQEEATAAPKAKLAPQARVPRLVPRGRRASVAAVTVSSPSEPAPEVAPATTESATPPAAPPAGEVPI